jgi:hypothetical protein
MRRSTKARTKEEIQLLSILGHIRDNPNPEALPRALRQKIADRLSIPEASIQSDDFFLSDVMQHALAKLMGGALGTEGSSKALTGFVIIHLRYFDFLHRGCSINKALDAFEDPHVAESVFDLLHKHSNMTGMQMTISSPEMLHLPWLKSISPKTAGRYAESAMKCMINLLGDCLSELFSLVSSIPASLVTAAVTKTNGATDLHTLINNYIIATGSLSSSAEDIQIPVAKGERRSVQTKTEPQVVRTEHLPKYLADRTVTISSLLGSTGRVLIQSVILLGNQNNLYESYYLIFPLITFLQRIKDGDTPSR